ncbi:MAG: OTU domain-containing protein, partial [Endozoicomonas sp.]
MNFTLFKIVMKRKALSQVKTQIIKRVYFVALIMAICAAVTKGDLVHGGFHPLNDDYDEATIESATSQWMIEVFNSAFPPAWKTTENPHSLPASKKSMSPVPIVINSAPKSGRNHDSHIEFTSSTLAWSIHLCTEQRINNLTLQEMSKSGQPKSGIEAISGNQYHFTTFEPFPHKSGKIVIYDPVLEKCSYLKVGDKIYTFSNAASKKPKDTVIEPSIRVNLRVSNQSILPSIMPSQDKRSGSSSSGDPDPWTDYNDHRKPFPYHFLNGKHPAINIAMSWIFKFHPPHIVQEILSSVSTYLAQTLFPQAAEDELNQLREDLQYAAHFAPTISFNQDGSPEIIFIRWNSDGTTKKEIISAHFFIYDEDQEGYDVPIDDFKRLARLFTASHASEDTPVEVFELLLKILTGSVYVKADDETKEETVLLTFNQFKKYIINFDKKKEPHEGQVKSDSQFVGTANEADKPDLQSNEESPVQLSESSISRYTSNLDRLLAGRQNISILGDGQCFFRAIAHYRQQEKHTSKVTRTDVQMIRRQIVDRLKEIVTNGDFREDSHRVIEQTGEDQARTLLRRFSSNISWGEMALIPVASELFQLNIAFVVPDHLGNIQGSIATMEGSTQSVEVEGLNHNIFIYHDGNDHWGISFPLTVPEQEGNTNNQSASQARSDASAHQNQTTSTTIQAHQETIINIPEHTGDDSPPPPSPVESGFQLDDVVLKKEQEDKYGPIAGFEFRLTNEIDEIIQILDSSPVIQKQNAERFVKQLNQYVAELNFLVSNIHQFGEVKRTAELFQEILPSQTRVLKSARRAINNLVNPD